MDKFSIFGSKRARATVLGENQLWFAILNFLNSILSVKERKGRSKENEGLVLKVSRKVRYGNYYKSLFV